MTVPPVHLNGRTTRDRPFQRINIPAARLVKLVRPDPAQNIFMTPVNGRGYDCGCRSTQDYDGKIGQEIGEEAAEVLEKIVPLFAAAKAIKDGIAKFLKGIPGAQKLSELIDGFDPLKALLGWLGAQIDALMVDSLVRSIPAWVPVFRRANKAELLVEAEVEGVLVRSHQRHDGIPYTQWHQWYDWSFLVTPVGNTAGIVGEGNRQRTRADADLKDDQKKSAALDARRYERGWMPPGANMDMSIQCEWDLGALGERRGPFLNTGRMGFDWGWPMAGQFFWATGRHVYDCTHATSNEKTGPNAGLHLNQLHPLKAFATQRWEGFKFRENRQAVPAAQFVLFASNARPSGGDFQFERINDVDWEFVVQLPPGGALASDDPYAIGDTNRAKLNTLDIGRRLLVDVNTGQFAGAGLHGGEQDFFHIEPVVTTLAAPDGNGAPTHARIRFPMKKVPDDKHNVGAIVSLGWHDPSGALAKTVHKVTITFTKVVIQQSKDDGAAEWQLNFGANGRWFHRFFTVPPGGGVETFSEAVVELFLAEDDFVQVAANGVEEDGVGDEYRLPEATGPDPEVPPPDAPKSEFEKFMEAFVNSRRLRLAREIEVPTGVNDDGTPKTERVNVPFVGDVVDWKKDMDQPLEQRELPAVKARASEVARALFLRNARIGFDGNDVVGLVDPNIFDPKKTGLGRSQDADDSPNPLSVKELLAEVGMGGTKSCRQAAYATTQLGRMGMLGYEEEPMEAPDGAKVFHAAKVDYVLHYDVKLEPQPAPPPPEERAAQADAPPAAAPA